MVISERLVHKYQEIYKRKLNKGISTKEAEQELLDLTKLIRLINSERKKRHDK